MLKNGFDYAFSITLTVAFAMVQILAYQWCEIGTLRRELRLITAAKAIADDQVRELNMNLVRAYSEQDSASIRGFIQGVVDAVNRPDHYTSIWHDGYNRGLETFKYATGDDQPR
jgi:hypothetical protein